MEHSEQCLAPRKYSVYPSCPLSQQSVAVGDGNLTKVGPDLSLGFRVVTEFPWIAVSTELHLPSLGQAAWALPSK